MNYPRKRGTLNEYLQKRSKGIVRPWSVFDTVRGSKSFVRRLSIASVLTGHDGCVNTVAWNDEGNLLLSGSDDCYLNIYDPRSEKGLYSMRSGHTANIFSAKFLPCTSDKKIVSCSGDGMVHYNELGNEAYYGQHPFRCHVGTTYEVLVTPGDPHTFITCGEDGTVRLFDLRVKNKCICHECQEDILIDCSRAVTSVSVNPLVPYHIAIGCEDSNARIFDRRTLGTTPESRSSFSKGKPMRGMFSKLKPEKLRSNRCRVTSLQYSPNGQDLLVSYCADYIYLFSMDQNRAIPLKTNNVGKSSIGDIAEDGDDLDSSSNLPPLKRLRLRGDWSDTGPNARPENEQGDSSENNLLQRMSDVFTRWLEDAFRASFRNASSSGESSQGEESRSERPRQPVRGRLIIGSYRSTERRSRAMRGSNRSRASSSDSEPQVSSPQELGAVARPSFAFDSNHSEEQGQDNSSLVPDGENAICTSGLMVVKDDGNLSSKEPLSRSTIVVTDGNTVEHMDINDECTSPNESSISVAVEQPLETGISEQTNDCSTNHSQSDAKSNSPNLTCKYDNETEVSRSTVTYESFANNSVDLDNNVMSLGEQNLGFPDCSLEREDSDGSDHTECMTTSVSTVENELSELSPESFVSSTVANCGSLVDGRRLDSEQEGPVGSVDVESKAENIRVEEDQGHDIVDSDHDDMDDEPLGSRRRHISRHSRRGARSLDENTAATRIQNFMRSHRELRESAACGKNVRIIRAAQCYKGHRNARTMIKEANFWGDHYVISGSDCGRIFIWDRHTAELVTFMSGDRHVVNCVQPHPFDPVLASSGIDYDIKLWAPVLPEPCELDDIDEVIRRNEQMLEESRDTITVPASFMLRMLASLSHVRGRRRQQEPQESSDSETEND